MTRQEWDDREREIERKMEKLARRVGDYDYIYKRQEYPGELHWAERQDERNRARVEQ